VPRAQPHIEQACQTGAGCEGRPPQDEHHRQPHERDRDIYRKYYEILWVTPQPGPVGVEEEVAGGGDEGRRGVGEESHDEPGDAEELIIRDGDSFVEDIDRSLKSYTLNEAVDKALYTSHFTAGNA